MRAALLAEPPTGDAAGSERPLGDGFELDRLIAELSGSYISRALKEADGNKSCAAELLGLNSRQTLNNRMRSLGLPS